MTNTEPAAGIRPPHRRARVWAAVVALLAAGAVGCSQSGQEETAASHAVRPTVTTTVTATATVTAEPEPAPTVTKTKTVHKPGPTVTVTRRVSTASGTTRTSSGSGGGGTCSIVSSAGNCYQAGQFCRNSDHGATTTTASGSRIRCAYSSNAWRWTYA
ncbi:hypothetical protein ACFW1F_24950 [Streptomyces bungoensis]|uniref:hypothetical protein n=1 Tax=Streptomyces bungoensis TaxID=285568 RepID=UPI003441D6C9